MTTSVDSKALALASTIGDAITAFETNQADLLKNAFEGGGADAAYALLNEVQALRDARYELLQRVLDEQAPGFEAAAKAIDKETKAIKKSIEQLDAVADTVETIAQVVNLVGRLIIMFGL